MACCKPIKLTVARSALDSMEVGVLQTKFVHDEFVQRPFLRHPLRSPLQKPTTSNIQTSQQMSDWRISTRTDCSIEAGWGSSRERRRGFSQLYNNFSGTGMLDRWVESSCCTLRRKPRGPRLPAYGMKTPATEILKFCYQSQDRSKPAWERFKHRFQNHFCAVRNRPSNLCIWGFLAICYDP